MEKEEKNETVHPKNHVQCENKVEILRKSSENGQKPIDQNIFEYIPWD